MTAGPRRSVPPAWALLALILAASCADSAPLGPLHGPGASATTGARTLVASINLLTNPGFESGGTGWPGATTSARSVVKTQKHSGTYSEQMTLSSKYGRATYQDVAVAVGSEYDAAGWIKGSGVGGKGARVRLIWLNASGLPSTPSPANIIRGDTVGVVRGTTVWTRVGGRYTAPTGAVVVRFEIGIATDPDNAGKAWFDSNELFEVTVPLPPPPPANDTTPPTVTITAPPDGTTASGIVTVTADATDDGLVAGVQFQVNGVNLGAEDPTAPYSQSLNTATLSNGSYTLTAIARDTAANADTSTAVIVNVSNVPLPNIVIVLTDDQRHDLMGYMPLITARLGTETVKFEYAFSPVPTCCPARVGILTGQHAHNHGVLQSYLPNGGATKFDPSSTIATWLRPEGYRTGIYGKYLNDYGGLSPAVPPGWDEFHVFVGNDDDEYYNYTLNHNGTHTTYGSGPQDYSTSEVARQAVQFITSTPSTQPIFLFFTPFGPHEPAKPEPGDIGTFSTLPPYRPPSYNEADVSDKPAYVQGLPVMDSTAIAASDAFHVRQVEALQSVDRAVAQLIDTLVATGRWSNTIFVYVSDNGLTWGEHRLKDRKNCVYDECMRVPMWVRVPGLTSRTDDHLVSLIDLAPTIAEWAGATPTIPVNGMSLVPLLNNPAASWRTEVLTEFLGATNTANSFSAVRTAQYLYAEYWNGDRELYDLQADPFQLTNVVTDPAYAATVTTMQNLLAALKAS
ncbi:MAG: sulfatase-like hydrolase/transferase [Gemmatimonadota bacterium]|nr:sulfatase-like hydrolase/transferase [Gemmatimonadota bacterium]